MPSAQALKLQIEHALERRFPAALSPAPRSALETAATGIATIDELIDGGLPVGAISEIVGPECSGRTSLALAFASQRTQQGQVCAWVDACDAFDAESAAASGVELKLLLWVRCREGDAVQRGGSRPAGNFDQPRSRMNKPWSRLDQAVRAADLLLQAGGFAAIVLDLGGTAPEFSRRIPLATWFRFRQAAERTRCSLVVLGQNACAQSSADLVLKCGRLRANSDCETLLSGFTYSVQRERGAAAKAALSIVGKRKPPQSTWSADGTWEWERKA
jgi:hypothetical protein